MDNVDKSAASEEGCRSAKGKCEAPRLKGAATDIKSVEDAMVWEKWMIGLISSFDRTGVCVYVCVC